MAKDKANDGGEAQRELTNVEVGEVSLVDAPAIRRRFLIVKRDEALEALEGDDTMGQKADPNAAPEETPETVAEETSDDKVDPNAEPAGETPETVAEEASKETPDDKADPSAEPAEGEEMSFEDAKGVATPILSEFFSGLDPDQKKAVRTFLEGPETTTKKNADEEADKADPVGDNNNSNDDDDEVKVAKAKRMTSGRLKKLKGALDNLTKLYKEFVDEAEAVAEEMGVSKSAENKTTTGGDATTNETPVEGLTVETLTKAVAGAIGLSLKDHFKAQDERLDTIAKRLDSVENTVPVAKSEGEPPAEKEPVEKAVATSELFPFLK